MKYILMQTFGIDTFTEEFETADKAIQAGKNEWARLSDTDRKNCAEFYVLESVNPDEDAEDHLDGNPIWDAKEWERDTNMTINYNEAEQMIIENQEMANEFATWLKDNRDKEAHEWDSDDLGEFFRMKGYETI
jgi:DNA primase catalytic subunit